MLKTVFLLPSLESGGIQTYVLRFLRWEESYLKVTIIVRESKMGDLYPEYRALNVPIFYFKLGYLNPYTWWKFFRFLNQESFDVICDFNSNFAGIPIWLAKMAKIQKRITFYRQGKNHFTPTPAKLAYNYFINKLVLKYSTKILSNSKSGMDYFFPNRNKADTRFQVIYNGIDLKSLQISINKNVIRQALDIPENGFIIGHVGRLDKAKNHETILRVAHDLIQKDSNIYLILCGNGTENLAKDVLSSGISKNTRLLGVRKDVNVLMQIFDVFYFPSLTEGQPNSLLEAMAIGKPIVASNINAIKEIMPKDYMLFEPYDVENVVKYIRRIKENPDSFMRNEIKSYTSAKFSAELRFKEFLLELTQ